MSGGPEAQGMLEALAEAGVLAPGETGRLEPLAGGVSSDVFAVFTSTGRRLVAKRAIPRLRVEADWRAPVERAGAEAAWLRFARGVDPRLAPQVLGEPPGGMMIVLEYLDPATHPVWKAELARGRVDDAFAARVGEALGRLHAASARDASIARRFADPRCFFELRVSPFLLFTASAHTDLAPRLEAMAQDLMNRRLALVHGDVSPKNILVGPAGPVFLDAETCVWGDPAFDLAFCVSHLLLEVVWLAHAPRSLRAMSRVLVEAYLQRVDWEAAAGLEERAAALVPALLLARVDGKSPSAYLDDPADRAFVRAASRQLLAADPSSLAQIVAGWSDALEERSR